MFSESRMEAILRVGVCSDDRVRVGDIDRDLAGGGMLVMGSLSLHVPSHQRSHSPCPGLSNSETSIFIFISFHITLDIRYSGVPNEGIQSASEDG